MSLGERSEIHLNHSRSGELIALAAPDSWFTYYYWLDNSRAPDFARTVDIHRKPGYDPVELFVDPKISLPRLKAAMTLAKRKLGMRTLMELTPLDAALVKGSHGLAASNAQDQPVVLTNAPSLMSGDPLNAVDTKEMILRHIFA